jgi:hypothetical protein
MLSPGSSLVDEINETLIVLDPSLLLNILELRHHVIVTLDLHPILITHTTPKTSQHAKNDEQNLDELIHDQISFPVNMDTMSLNEATAPDRPPTSIRNLSGSDWSLHITVPPE